MDPITLNLYGEIGWELTAKYVSDVVDADPENPEMNIRMHSHGGDVFEGFAIMSVLSRFKGKKIGYIDGVAASMMSAIACVCDELKISENGWIMIHNPFTMFADGNSEELRKQADLLDKITTTLSAAYQRRTGLSESEVKGIMDAETWYNADDALAVGLVDEIIEPVQMAALSGVQFEKLSNPPKAIRKIAADARLREALRVSAPGAPGENNRETIKTETEMKINIKSLKKKFPGADVEAIVRAIRAEGGETEELPGSQSECENQGHYWYDDGCHKNPKPATEPSDATLAALPDNQADCESAGKHWYDGSCHDEPQSKAEDGGVPATREECESAGKFWYDDACHDEAQSQASDSGSGGGGGTTTITTTVTTAEADRRRIKALEGRLDNMNKAAAKRIAGYLLAGTDFSDDQKRDIQALIRPTSFIKDGILDEDAYDSALREKIEKWGGKIVDGPGYHLDAPPMNTPRNKANGYDREYIKNLRAGK